MDDSRYKRAASGGWLNGMLGVVIFSGSLPATRLALRDFDPLFLTVARASIAGLLALAIVMLRRERWPQGAQWRSLVVVAIGVVVGFPLLTALALQHVTSAHSIVFIGLLPLATALFGVPDSSAAQSQCGRGFHGPTRHANPPPLAASWPASARRFAPAPWRRTPGAAAQ